MTHSLTRSGTEIVVPIANSGRQRVKTVYTFTVATIYNIQNDMDLWAASGKVLRPRTGRMTLISVSWSI